jgi:hypothetical protein
MLFNIKPSDVNVDVSDATSPAIRLEVLSSRIFGAVGPFSVDAAGKLLLTKPIFLSADIVVGTLPAAVLARSDWSFGFVQAISLGQFFATWSGAKSNAGSVSVNFDDTGSVFPDFDDDTPDGRAASPFTRKRADRFKYDPAKGKIRCENSDGPAFVLPAIIKNLKTSADNFLQSVKDARQICCALVVEEQAEKPKLRFIGHSIWDLHLLFELKWVRGNIVPTSSSKVSVGQFKFGPPDDPDLKQMLDDKILGRTTYNKLMTDQLTNTVKALHSDKKVESDTWFLSTPRDFFKP